MSVSTCESVRLLTHAQVEELLRGQEHAVIERVLHGYEEFAAGRAVLPHSVFLPLSASSPDRIIALPAYLSSDTGVAGIKWVSSVPSNVTRGLDRASAIIAVNDRATGRVTDLLEGAVISAKRTAASAALAALRLAVHPRPANIALIGLGPINLETLCFVCAVVPTIEDVYVYDIDERRMSRFSEHCAARLPPVRLHWVTSIREALSSAPIVSIATTATTPHIASLEGIAPETLILHISLRDFSVEAILAASNVVDDVAHVCRANTSVHLASQCVGHTNFMLPLVKAIARPRAEWAQARPTIFSPFGLGVLDLAVAALVLKRARDWQIGTVVPQFHAPRSRELL